MATCSSPPIPDKNASGDNWYGQDICRQDMIDYFWTTYGFNGNKAYWENGWGWHDPCNTDLPLARTFNGCYALTYSAQDYLNDAWDAPQNILQWGRRFVRESIDDLRAKCGDGTADASESGGTVELYLGYFYNEAVPERASTLCHEARHVGASPTTRNSRADPSTARGRTARIPIGTTRVPGRTTQGSPLGTAWKAPGPRLR